MFKLTHTSLPSLRMNLHILSSHYRWIYKDSVKILRVAIPYVEGSLTQSINRGSYNQKAQKSAGFNHFEAIQYGWETCFCIPTSMRNSEELNKFFTKSFTSQSNFKNTCKISPPTDLCEDYVAHS